MAFELSKNTKLVIGLVEYYKALLELKDIWWDVRSIAYKVNNYQVSRKWGEKRIHSLATDAIDIFKSTLLHNELYLQMYAEDDYPERRKAVEFLESFREYLYKVSNGNVSISEIPDREWIKTLFDMMSEVEQFIDYRVPPKEYVEPIHAMRELKSSSLTRD